MRLIVFLLLALGLQGILAKPIFHCLVTETVTVGDWENGGTAAYHAVFDPATGSFSNVIETAFLTNSAKSSVSGAEFDPFTRNFYHTIYSPQSDPAFLYYGSIVGTNVDSHALIIPTVGWAIFDTASLNSSGSLVIEEDASMEFSLAFWRRNGQTGKGITYMGKLTNGLDNENFVGGRVQDDKYIYLSVYPYNQYLYKLKYFSLTNPGDPITMGSFFCGERIMTNLARNATGDNQYLSLAYYPTSNTSTQFYIARFSTGNKCTYNTIAELPQTGQLADWNYDAATNQLWVFYIDLSGNSVYYVLNANTGKIVQKVPMPKGYTIVNFDVEYTN